MSISVTNLCVNKFISICRTCSLEGELVSLYENVYLIEMLKFCSQLQFDPNDGLPKQICVSCIENLNQAYTFSVKCKMVDSALRKCLLEQNLLNIKTEIITNQNEFDTVSALNNCKTELPDEDDPTCDDLKDSLISDDHLNNLNEPITELSIEEKLVFSCAQCHENFDTKEKHDLHMGEAHMKRIRPPEKQKRKGNPRKRAVSSNNNLTDSTTTTPGDCTTRLSVPSPTTTTTTTTTTTAGIVKVVRTFECEICHKVMNNLSNLRRHELIHTDVKRFKCNVCNKCFRHSGTLITHQRGHSGERPCVCDVCGKTYIDLSTLGRHKKIHLGQKPFECDVCHKRFTQGGDLKIHKRLHTEKPYVCDICQKRFNRTGHLLKHRRVHFKNTINDISQFLSAENEMNT